MRASPLLLANCETPIYAVKIVHNNQRQRRHALATCRWHLYPFSGSFAIAYVFYATTSSNCELYRFA